MTTNFSTRFRNVVSSTTRTVPQFRGLGRLCNAVNNITLKLGAPPLAEAKMRDGTQILVDLTTTTEKMAFYRGCYEPRLTTLIHSLLNQNDYFLDIGANIGFYTVSVGALFRANSAHGKVISFEPFAGNYERLVNNISQNRLSEYCISKKIGLSDVSKTSEITLREDFHNGSQTGNAAIPTNEDFDRGFQRVPIILNTLDNLWKNTDLSSCQIDLMKIDIEGHEDFCLRGARNTIAMQRPAILMEINKTYYKVRKVDIDEVFLPLIPDEYSVFCEIQSQWKEISSFSKCKSLDNVFFIPRERLCRATYSHFQDIKDSFA